MCGIVGGGKSRYAAMNLEPKGYLLIKASPQYSTLKDRLQAVATSIQKKTSVSVWLIHLSLLLVLSHFFLSLMLLGGRGQEECGHGRACGVREISTNPQSAHPMLPHQRHGGTCQTQHEGENIYIYSLRISFFSLSLILHFIVPGNKDGEIVERWGNGSLSETAPV
jgi:hypothetical protein